MAKAPIPPQPQTTPDPQDQGGFPIPPALAGQPGVDLLMDACEVFGINPDPTLPPYDPKRHGAAKAQFLELVGWKYYPALPGEPLPNRVVLVTAGGQKLTWFDDPDYPLDPATELALRNLFHAWTIDPTTKDQVPLPLPADLTLPRQAVDGRPKAGDHVYQKGYLREGGRAESDRRAGRQKG